MKAEYWDVRACLFRVVRRTKLLAQSCVIFLIVSSLGSALLFAQVGSSATRVRATLPDAPQQAQATGSTDS